MSIFRSKRLEQELGAVKQKTDRTAEELIVVKKRQEGIERRLKFLQQELQVQIRDTSNA